MKPKATLEWLLPPQITSGRMRLAKYMICACGLASDTVGDVTIDSKVALVQPHPQSSIYMCPLGKNSHPSYFEALFYADCISYENETPSIVYPTKKEVASFNYRYAYAGPSKPQEIAEFNSNTGKRTTHIRKPIDPRRIAYETYVDQVIAVMELVRELRHGALTYILFQTFDRSEKVDLKYSERYGPLAKEIGLYASALKQPDFLSEYLCYYRILESVSQANGKEWITENLPVIRKHSYGNIAIRHDLDGYRDKPKNLLSIYRRRALSRYGELKRRFGTDGLIAKYLYEVNRCGIAHGKRDSIQTQLKPNYFEVGRDSIVLKMLARSAIDAN